MNDGAKQLKRDELFWRIIENTISEKEAILEYMNLGYNQELSRKIYLEIRGEAITASCGGCIE
jgi:hypothetical protein